MTHDQAVELINRRRRQLLVHSCMYYRLNENIISDHTYDAWSKELAQLQLDHPGAAAAADFADDFADFDGSTGFHLPTGDPWVLNKAAQLLNYHRKHK